MPLIVLCRIFKSGFRRPLEVTTLIPTDHTMSNILLSLSSEQVRRILNSLGQTLSLCSKEQLSDDPKLPTSTTPEQYCDKTQ